MATIDIPVSAFAGLGKTAFNTLLRLWRAEAVMGGKIYATGLNKRGKPTGFAGAPSNTANITILQSYALGIITSLEVQWQALSPAQQFAWSINQERIAIYNPKNKLFVSLPVWVQYWCNEYGGLGYGFPFFAATNVLNMTNGLPLIDVPMYPFTVRPGNGTYNIDDYLISASTPSIMIHQNQSVISNFHFNIIAGPVQPPGCMKYTGNYKLISTYLTPFTGWIDIYNDYIAVYPAYLQAGWKIPITLQTWYDLSGLTWQQKYTPYPITS